MNSKKNSCRGNYMRKYGILNSTLIFRPPWPLIAIDFFRSCLVLGGKKIEKGLPRPGFEPATLKLEG